MSGEQLLVQLFTQMLEESGAEITFSHQSADSMNREGDDALEAIAACLRKETDDFTCVDEIIEILEQRGYRTVPRHDFG